MSLYFLVNQELSALELQIVVYSNFTGVKILIFKVITYVTFHTCLRLKGRFFFP